MQPGIWQILLILLVVLIFFGAGKLPRMMGDLGKGMRNLRKGLQGEDDDAGDSSAKEDKPKISASASASLKEEDAKQETKE